MRVRELVVNVDFLVWTAVLKSHKMLSVGRASDRYERTLSVLRNSSATVNSICFEIKVQDVFGLPVPT